jgi:hypothetical protein
MQTRSMANKIVRLVIQTNSLTGEPLYHRPPRKLDLFFSTAGAATLSAILFLGVQGGNYFLAT